MLFFSSTRQPIVMPLFTGANTDSLKQLMLVIHTALQTPVQSVVMSAITTFSHLLWYIVHVLYTLFLENEL